MIGIFIICYLVFPITVLLSISKAISSDEFFGKQDSDVIKGIATSFVILSHLTINLEGTWGCNKFLSIFTVLGGMGVLMFFFLSGYGLYKGYGGKQLGISFWKKRLVGMYLPCVVIQFAFCIVKAVGNQSFEFWSIVVNSLFGAWFIDIILIQYFIFFISWMISKGNTKQWVIISFILSTVVALVFWKLKYNARWYNGLLLFPFGMLIAYKEKIITKQISKRWNFALTVSGLLFVVSGAFFTAYKGRITWIDLAKTFSGMCLCMMTYIFFMRIKICTSVMKYIGKRSLYFYLIHINILTMLNAMEQIGEVCVFYLVILLTFPLVELVYKIFHYVQWTCVLIKSHF